MIHILSLILAYSIFQHIKHIRVKQEWEEGMQTSVPKWWRPEKRIRQPPHTRTFMSLNIKSLVEMLGHPSECTPMTSHPSCCHLVVLTLHPFCVQPERFSDKNTRRIQVPPDAFVLTLQSYFSFFSRVRTKRRD